MWSRMCSGELGKQRGRRAKKKKERRMKTIIVLCLYNENIVSRQKKGNYDTALFLLLGGVCWFRLLGWFHREIWYQLSGLGRLRSWLSVLFLYMALKYIYYFFYGYLGWVIMIIIICHRHKWSIFCSYINIM